MGYHHIQNHQRFHAMPPCLCEKCPENAATPRTLQARVAFLETQLEAARAEKSSAEKTVNYVLRLNAENTTRFSSGISEKTKSRLLRKIARANVEKEYFKDLLQQAIEAVVRLSAKGAINVKDRSLSGKTSEESANALIDFLGLDDCSVTKSPGGGLSTVNEIIQDNNFRKNHPEIEDVQMLGAQISATLSAQESTENSANNQEDLLDFNDLSPTKASDDRFSLINENSGCLQDTYGVENTEVLNDQLPTENSSDTEDDNLSNSSYIFHFSHPHMDRNSSSTDDEVFMIVRHFLSS